MAKTTVHDNLLYLSNAIGAEQVRKAYSRLFVEELKAFDIPLQDRDRTIDAIMRSFQGLKHGLPRLFLIRGRSGSGKTHFLRQLHLKCAAVMGADAPQVRMVFPKFSVPPWKQLSKVGYSDGLRGRLRVGLIVFFRHVMPLALVMAAGAAEILRFLGPRLAIGLGEGPLGAPMTPMILLALGIIFTLAAHFKGKAPEVAEEGPICTDARNYLKQVEGPLVVCIDDYDVVWRHERGFINDLFSIAQEDNLLLCVVCIHNEAVDSGFAEHVNEVVEQQQGRTVNKAYDLELIEASSLAIFLATAYGEELGGSEFAQELHRRCHGNLRYLVDEAIPELCRLGIVNKSGEEWSLNLPEAGLPQLRCDEGVLKNRWEDLSDREQEVLAHFAVYGEPVSLRAFSHISAACQVLNGDEEGFNQIEGYIRRGVLAKKGKLREVFLKGRSTCLALRDSRTLGLLDSDEWGGYSAMLGQVFWELFTWRREPDFRIAPSAKIPEAKKRTIKKISDNVGTKDGINCDNDLLVRSADLFLAEGPVTVQKAEALLNGAIYAEENESCQHAIRLYQRCNGVLRSLRDQNVGLDERLRECEMFSSFRLARLMHRVEGPVEAVIRSYRECQRKIISARECDEATKGSNDWAWIAEVDEAIADALFESGAWGKPLEKQYQQTLTRFETDAGRFFRGYWQSAFVLDVSRAVQSNGLPLDITETLFDEGDMALVNTLDHYFQESSVSVWVIQRHFAVLALALRYNNFNLATNSINLLIEIGSRVSQEKRRTPREESEHLVGAGALLVASGKYIVSLAQSVCDPLKRNSDAHGKFADNLENALDFALKIVTAGEQLGGVNLEAARRVLGKLLFEEGDEGIAPVAKLSAQLAQTKRRRLPYRVKVTYCKQLEQCMSACADELARTGLELASKARLIAGSLGDQLLRARAMVVDAFGRVFIASITDYRFLTALDRTVRQLESMRLRAYQPWLLLDLAEQFSFDSQARSPEIYERCFHCLQRLGFPLADRMGVAYKLAILNSNNPSLPNALPNALRWSQEVLRSCRVPQGVASVSNEFINHMSAMSLQIMGKTYSKMGKFVKAIEMLDKAERFAIDANTKALIFLRKLDVKRQTRELQGRELHDQYHACLDRFVNLKDDFYVLLVMANMLSYCVKFDTEKQFNKMVDAMEKRYKTAKKLHKDNCVWILCSANAAYCLAVVFSSLSRMDCAITYWDDAFKYYCRLDNIKQATSVASSWAQIGHRNDAGGPPTCVLKWMRKVCTKRIEQLEADVNLRVFYTQALATTEGLRKNEDLLQHKSQALDRAFLALNAGEHESAASILDDLLGKADLIRPDELDCDAMNLRVRILNACSSSAEDQIVAKAEAELAKVKCLAGSLFDLGAHYQANKQISMARWSYRECSRIRVSVLAERASKALQSLPGAARGGMNVSADGKRVTGDAHQVDPDVSAFDTDLAQDSRYARLLFNVLDFQMCLKTCERLVDSECDPREWEILQHLCRGYLAWDRFSFAEAHAFLQNAAKKMRQYQMLPELIDSIDRQVEIFSVLAQAKGLGKDAPTFQVFVSLPHGGDAYLVIDRLARAGRRGTREDQDYCVIDQYRALEMMVQLRLARKYDIDADHAVSPLLKSGEFSEAWHETGSRIYGGGYVATPPSQKLAMLDGTRILMALGDPLVQDLDTDALISYAALRNKSHHIHGLRTIGRKENRKFNAFVKRLCKRYHVLSGCESSFDSVLDAMRFVKIGGHNL